VKRITDTRIFALVCLNAALYASILTLDILKVTYGITRTQGHICDVFKYTAIISCLIICIFALSHTRKQTARIQAIVFCFTLGADFCLLFTSSFAIGIGIFLGAHTFALIRYRRGWALPAGICAAALFFVVIGVFPRVMHADTGLALTFAVSIAYAVLIITVAISTFFAEQPCENAIFSRLGMILFLACDINVAVFNTLPSGHALYTASVILMWAFYLPAQTLLALSATDLPLINHRRSSRG